MVCALAGLPTFTRGTDVSADAAADDKSAGFSKVPLITMSFWIVKVLATTVGETGGDALSMTLDLGYLVSTLIFLGFFVVTLTAQVASRRYHPVLYWLVVVATTTLGTTTSDYMDRTLGLGYVKSSVVLFAGVIMVLVAWHFVFGPDRISECDLA